MIGLDKSLVLPALLFCLLCCNGVGVHNLHQSRRLGEALAGVARSVWIRCCLYYGSALEYLHFTLQKNGVGKPHHSAHFLQAWKNKMWPEAMVNLEPRGDCPREQPVEQPPWRGGVTSERMWFKQFKIRYSQSNIKLTSDATENDSATGFPRCLLLEDLPSVENMCMWLSIHSTEGILICVY